MTSFPGKLRLKEQADEDAWFARRDRALLEALHRPHAGIEVVSGGQSGVDRAALDAALEAGLRVGGWCPAGRLAEDGPIDARYPLRETPTSAFAQRTEWNVRDADATLILYRGPLRGGTALTAEYAARLGRPVLLLDLSTAPDPAAAAQWVRRRGVRVLNCAGPRESGAPGIYAEAKTWIGELLHMLVASPGQAQGDSTR